VLAATLGATPDEPLTILCLGAHSDDIEIGCGGTLLRLLRDRPGSSVHWTVFSAEGCRATEARAAAAAFTCFSGTADVRLHAFRENHFPFDGSAIKDAVASIARDVAPDVVFTHRRDDAHQDHRTIGELTWNHFRDHLVLEYEIPKYDGDLGRPTVYSPLPAPLAELKVDLLLEHFGSQRARRWFTRETFCGLMAVRGVECNAPSGFAEAFFARKLTI
jgi:LmbE family N-acetylglucosaminyl deacetylase